MNGNNETYSFNGFTFSEVEGCLRFDDEIIKLSPTALAVLGILLKRRGELVSRETLIEEVWRDTIVEEANLTVAVSQIRKVLSKKAQKETKFIRTIPKKGYIFIADVETVIPVEKDKSSPPSIETARTNGLTPKHFLAGLAVIAVFFATSFAIWSFYGPKKGLSEMPISERSYESLAVLPIKDLDDTKDSLAFGLTDSLISRLGRLNRFAVRPLSAVSEFSESEKDALSFSKDLNVDAVVVGTIQRSGEKVRLRMQLLDSRDGAQLWSETFDVAERNVFDAQDQMSSKIAQSLVRELTSADEEKLESDETKNLDALRLYSQAHFFLAKRTKTDIEKALKLFEDANEQDPDFVKALKGQIECHVLLSDSLFLGVPTQDRKDRVEKLIERILAKRKDDGDALAAKGFLAF